MKRKKKKRMSTLVRVLLCSWCVLGLVLTFFVIDWAMNLSKPENPPEPGHVDVFANVTGVPETPVTATPGKEPDGKLPEPTAVPMPQAEFVKEYAHTGESIEHYGYMGKVTYALRHPRRDDAAQESGADEMVQGLLSEKLTELSETAGEFCTLVIDYEDGETAGLYSVLFYVETDADGVKETETKLWIYNKKKGKPVEDAAGLFDDLAYRYVAEQVNLALAKTSEEVGGSDAGMTTEGMEENVPQKPEGPFSGTREEFPEYVLTADGAKFFYENDGERQAIVLPYIALHTYMAVTENGTVVADTIRELDPDAPMIALTFDDGPHYQQTPRLLEVLDRYDVKSTFFILGERTLWGASSEKTLKMVYEAGHEVASHTHTHKNLKEISVEDMKAEIVNARNAIFSVIGEYPTMVRPPYGAYNDDVKAYSYAPLITWNLDSEDWKSRDTQTVVKHVLEEAGDGKIVLMHDIHWFTVDAVELLIPALQERGYQVVTVQELFHYKNVELENGRVYHSSYN